MITLLLDTIRTAWMNSRQPQLMPVSLLLQPAIIRSLVSAQPISVAQAAADTGLSIETVGAYFAQFQACGAEVDEAGKVTGWILSLNPTPHRLRINDHTLYAWCALDTLFLPALIGQPAKIKSICAATDTKIGLIITPTGVTASYPSSTVLSIVVPGRSSVCKTCQDGEIAGAVCYAMHFFSSCEAAAQWLGSDSDVAILALEEAWQLAHTVWVEPVAKAIKATNSLNIDLHQHPSSI
jgi:alkylmercury lyase